MGCEVYGMDSRMSALRKAKAKLKEDGIPDRLEKGDIKEMKFPSGEFDFVHANAIPAKTTENGWNDVLRILKPGGKAYITLIQEAYHLNRRPMCGKFDFSYGTEEVLGWFPFGDKNYKIEFQELYPRPANEETSIGPRLTTKLLVKIEKLV
jgi:ubiquinone/menaquinone biosynthesis C-methylase UbiE